MRLRWFAALAATLATAPGTSGCVPAVDLAASLQVEDVATGWFDAGVVDGKTKIVPAVSLKLKNRSDQTLSTLQVNAVFRRVDQAAEWDAGFLTAAGSGGLAPAASTGLLLLKAERGYTGTDPQWALLQNSQFVDAKVDVFAKYASSQWARLGEYPIRRVLIER